MENTTISKAFNNRVYFCQEFHARHRLLIVMENVEIEVQVEIAVLLFEHVYKDCHGERGIRSISGDRRVVV